MTATSSKLRVLLIAPYYDKHTPGESWSTYQWVERVCRETSATVLTSHHKGWDASKSPIQAERIVEWNDPMLPRRLARLDFELKPGYFLFYFHARRWLLKNRRELSKFDLVHQINPLGMRYPSPAAGLGLKLILGPYAGSLKNPPGFPSSSTDRTWFRKLRTLDELRFKYDPWLKRGFKDARLVLGAAPYVKDILSAITLKRFEAEGETGVEELLPLPPRSSAADRPLKLLYVGRIIRTKGLIDAIRALGALAADVPLVLDILGDGDMRAECESETKRLGLERQVTFHGRVPRATVTEYYRSSDLFVFPSFREPSGNVVFESLGCGLPVLTTDLGGPGYVVDGTCGVRVSAKDPESLSANIAQAILHIHRNRQLLSSWSEGAQKRIKEIAHWNDKANRLLGYYRQIAQEP